jgi:hypothetical protein
MNRSFFTYEMPINKHHHKPHVRAAYERALKQGEDGQMIKWDKQQQRVWVAGWRLHHGLTGAVLAVAGGLLMAHDWKDRTEWIHH